MGGGHGPLVHLSYSVTVVQQDLSTGAKRGSEATERMEGVEGGTPLPPMVGRFFSKLCMKLALFAH